MNSIESPVFARNYGFWTEEEQQALIGSRVAIAGVGGDGFQLGLKLAMNGVGAFDVADPEVFEPENTNRVPGAIVSTYGRKKAEVFAERVYEINPDATVRIFDDGVTPENVEEFLSQADLVYDESELTYMHIGTAVARAARKRNIPDVMVMNIGFAAQVTSFHPQSERHTFERFMGIPKDMPLDEVKELKLRLDRCVPYIPTYADLETLKAVELGSPLPSIAQGVDVASAIGATQGFLHLVGKGNNRPDPIWAPRVAYIDSYNFKAGITRYPRLSHYRHLAGMVLRNSMHTNSSASYTEADRQRRSPAV